MDAVERTNLWEALLAWRGILLARGRVPRRAVDRLVKRHRAAEYGSDYLSWGARACVYAFAH